MNIISPTILNLILNIEKISFQEYFTQVMVNFFCEDILRLEIISKDKGSLMTSIENLICCNPNLIDVDCDDFEIAFLSYFKTNPKNKIELNKFIQKVYNYQFDNWRKKIATSKKLDNYFNQNYLLNKQGENLKNELINKISVTDSGIRTSFFDILIIDNKNSKLNISTSDRKKLFIRNPKSNFDLKKIDFIYQSVIKICSENSTKDNSLNWGKYNSGSVGQG